MDIERIVCGSLEANCYIIFRKDGGSAYIIDPGYDKAHTQAFVKEHGLSVKAILLTHGHHDHSGKANALAEYYGVEVCVHMGELEYSNFKGTRISADKFLEDGETLDLDGERITVFHTPGHSVGGLCYYSDKSRVAFTGDTIFNVDLGYTHFETGSAEQMKQSLINVVNKRGNDVTIYPGHGDPATMKYVRSVNREFLDMIAGS